jgi:hypothetical protein
MENLVPYQSDIFSPQLKVLSVSLSASLYSLNDVPLHIVKKGTRSFS